MSDKIRTLGQERAEFALNELLKLDLKDKEKKEFKAFAAGAPSMILQNGLGQALAFFLAKGQNKHIHMFHIITKWLNYKSNDNDYNFIKKIKGTSEKDYIIAISEMEQKDYLAAQTETIKLLEWIKRYAVAFYDEKESN